MFPLILALLPAASPAYEWKPVSDADQAALYHRGRQIGGYDFERSIYRTYDAKNDCWGNRCQPPVTPPRKAVRNFGLERDKLKGGERYRHNGKEITRQEVRQILEKTIPDDAGRPRLTVIGPEEERRRVADDLSKHPALADYRDRFAVQAYRPEDWAVARAGFVTTGKPTIYVQSADGVVLHRQDDYAGGPEALAAALRKADPLYLPGRDPDRRLPNLVPHLPNVPWSCLVLAAVAAGVLLLPRSKP